MATERELWRQYREFQKELEYLKEEAKIDEKTKAEKEAQAKAEAASAAAAQTKTDEKERGKRSDATNQRAFGEIVPAGMNQALAEDFECFHEHCLFGSQ